MVTGLLGVAYTQNSYAARMRCQDVLVVKDPIADILSNKYVAPTTQAEAWKESFTAMQEINGVISNRGQVIEALMTAVLAKEFVWMNGEPGGAKTLLSRMVFKSVLNTITDKQKKIFVIQFHKLISEGKIIGFPKFSKMMKEGKFEVETKSSLVADDVLFMIADEAEKSNPATLNALLSVLNERKAFLGGKVVEAILASGVLTSNKTTGEFIQGFGNDRPSGEALLDRMALKIHIPNQENSASEMATMFYKIKNASKSDINMPLMQLQSLVDKVKISETLMREIVAITEQYDRYVINKADKSREDVRMGELESEYFPANQFSNRSQRRMIQVMKAGFIVRQLAEGVPYEQIRLAPTRSDLGLLAKSALYIGPSAIQMKTFPLSITKSDGTVNNEILKVVSDFGSVHMMSVRWSPYEGIVRVVAKDGEVKLTYRLEGKEFKKISHADSFEDWSIDPTSLKALLPIIEKSDLDNKVDVNKPQFEVDGGIDKLLTGGVLQKRTKIELENIKQDIVQLTEVLNQQIEKDVKHEPLSKIEYSKQRTTKEHRAFRRTVRDLPPDKRAESYYHWLGYELKALKERFVELDHSLEAHMTALLAETHVYAFGPPGGAKTALAEVLLKSELKNMNAKQVDQFVREVLKTVSKDKKYLRQVLTRMSWDKPEVYQRFMLQFHKLVPEGVLTGFPKVEKQLNDGVEEIDTSTSLSGEKFIFAILDEVDKANPQTLTALLSILNEREVFVGNSVIKTSLRTAILTSNKMPSELLDSYAEDRSAGQAFLDRVMNKVYVSNKISSEEALTRFLMNLENGISPSWKGLTGIKELKPLVDQVEFESDVMPELMASIFKKYLTQQVKKYEDSMVEHRQDPVYNPHYYVPGTEVASNRTYLALMNQIKSRFIVHQLMDGVPYEKVRLSIDLQDLALFFEGLGYWAPQNIKAGRDSDGVLHFTHEADTLTRLIDSGRVDARVKYHLNMMKDEGREFTQVLNDVIRQFQIDYKAMIAQYPQLFPSLFNAEARAKFEKEYNEGNGN
jgi:MoxR-like ATPases